MGGPVFGLKRAIDEGLYEGPRIYPSGALITQTRITSYNVCYTKLLRTPEPQRTLITNTRIFDGTSPTLSGPMDVLVEGNTIARIGASVTAPQGTRVIDADGRTLMPGLTDCHWHTIQANLSNAEALSSDLDYITLAAAVGAEQALMRGFTTIRDVGGPVFGLKKMRNNFV